ncbi:hypothetical protein KMT30_03765 [Streptomyces sp. IBSBF 2953]|uniref:hypothetical protein n=1 Tax=Streptomyces TaxID=1883 RepID=UPI0029AA40E4|nr:hypothetical protein [Streptomyces scabiei]MCQ9178169.1 hypothetical protein [Streptomyces hayashii]MDX3119249.1 hypothetical protein [Streptomyces scabiei]
MLRHTARRRRLALSAILAVVIGSGATGTSHAAGSDSPPPVHGPGARAVAAAEPNTPNGPEVGPPFTKTSGVWQVGTTTPTLRNTVTAPSGHKTTATFEVHTTDSSGKPTDTVVKVSDDNQWGVLVSGEVTAGQPASMPVPAGKLKNGVTYAVRSSGYDATSKVYESDWSPYSTFKINVPPAEKPYVTFPAPQATSSIDSLAQTPIEFTRTDPGPIAGARGVNTGRTCSAPDAEGRRVCIEISRDAPTPEDAAVAKRTTRQSIRGADLVAWCASKPDGKAYMNRTEACLKNVGYATLIFVDADELPVFGTATFALAQQIKLYNKKADTGTDRAEFDQQLTVIPTHIDAATEGVHLTWVASDNCADCTNSQVQWSSSDGLNHTPHWAVGEVGAQYAMTATLQTIWNGTGKEQFDLGWILSGSVDAGNAHAQTSLGSSGDIRVRELAPRCDDIAGGNIKTGCVFPFFKPTWTVDTNLYPAAGAYYWLMQEKLPSHPGSRKWDSLVTYLGPGNKAGPDESDWTNVKSRSKVCPSSWAPNSATPNGSCDEFAPASTYQSGGMPKGPNQVNSGNDCAQLYTKPMTGGTWGLLAENRDGYTGPKWNEKCGRASVPLDQNESAFRDLGLQLVPQMRLLDKDGFFISDPGFEHCKNADTVCAWKKIG